MTENELIERALREEGVFPPSVMDCNYGDTVEMTRGEIIVRTLDEMGMLSLSEQDAQCGNKIRYIHIVIEELQRRLPDGDIVTCGAFSVLNVGCCDVCHTDPLHGMTLLDLPGCSMAWICCAVDAASSPEPYPVFHERERKPFRRKGAHLQISQWRPQGGLAMRGSPGVVARFRRRPMSTPGVRKG